MYSLNEAELHSNKLEPFMVHVCIVENNEILVSHRCTQRKTKMGFLFSLNLVEHEK